MSNIGYTENGIPNKTNKDIYKETLTKGNDILTENTFKPLVKKNIKTGKGLWATLVAGLAFLAKFKFILVFLKLGEFGSTLISMFVMIWIYAAAFGWAFGVGFVALLFVHKMGHYIMARKLGIDISAPLFIPFVGAVISMRQAPKDVITEAKIALGGPVLGSLAAMLCLLLYYVGGQDIFLALTYMGFMLNLFNLIPMYPIDGGRIVSAISPKIWFVGIPITAMVAYKFFNPILFIFIVFGIIQAVNQYKNPNKEYYKVELSTRLTFATFYFGLIILLGIGMYYIHSSNGAGYNF